MSQKKQKSNNEYACVCMLKGASMHQPTGLMYFFCAAHVFAEDKTKDVSQEQEKKPLPQLNLCNEDGCFSHPGGEEAERSTTPQELPAFFSLEALAEVAAMENVHR